MVQSSARRRLPSKVGRHLNFYQTGIKRAGNDMTTPGPCPCRPCPSMFLLSWQLLQQIPL